ncbi:alpha/beta hydrolase [Microbulbifer sp. A4B17]|uniref:alpha/beta hydrolase n=1 Tax=Microbulbifer sp. A4B17 TaxID=359370 RepID=UPI000D52DDB2|nr:alpha/beta fold hydrolase [Microbulbifer sp. A4B17]AWF80424.1 alpha/beta hydrolase [Microbulbifer sp. A4B17]
MKSAIKLNTIFAVITACLTMSACSQRIAKLIENSESFPFDRTITSKEINELGFKKGKYCTDNNGNCITYYYASPLHQDSLHYSIEFDTHDRKSVVRLELQRDSIRKDHTGTVILLHGFRSSKEFMLHSALYFRFLGYRVIVPDLLGHGESSGNKKYGVGDSTIINELVDNLITKKEIKNDHIYIVGNSMGALTALYLSALRTDIDGIILLAPMVPFDQALYNYSRLNHPILSLIIPEKDVRQGANLALTKAGIEPGDTNILPLLNSSELPILLLSSPADRIAPSSNYKGLDKANIQVCEISDRNHPSMATIGNAEHKVILQWLNELAQ